VGRSAKNNFSFKELQTGTICPLPDFREGWGGYTIKILNSLIPKSFTNYITNERPSKI